jgi:iron(III) transport system permease protein
MATAAATLRCASGGWVGTAIVHWRDRLAQALLVGCCAALALPCWARSSVLVKSVRDKEGAFVGLLSSASIWPLRRDSIWNTLWVALVVTGITIPLAFIYAYALTRSCMRRSSASSA